MRSTSLTAAVSSAKWTFLRGRPREPFSTRCLPAPMDWPLRGTLPWRPTTVALGALTSTSLQGTLASKGVESLFARVWTWDPALRRLYFFRDSQSPNDLHYEVISPEGSIAATGESPYHGEFSAVPPIGVNTDGEGVLLGTGITPVIRFDLCKPSGQSDHQRGLAGGTGCDCA